MSKVQFQPFEAGITSASGCRDEIITHARNVGYGHRRWHFRQVGTEGDRGGRDGLPAARIAVGDMVVTFPRKVGAGLASCVADLDARYGTGCLDGRDDRREGLGLLVGPDAGAARSNAALWGHSRRFDDHQPRATACEAGEVHTVPIVDQTVDSGVLAHRRNRDAVAQRDVFELIGCE